MLFRTWSQNRCVVKLISMHSIYVAVSLPPPVHGQSTVNLALLEELKKYPGVTLEVVDISPKQAKKNFTYHLNRIWAVAKGACLLIKSVFSKRKGAAYFVFESGYGVVYNIVLISLARIAGKRIYLHHHTAFHTLSYSAVFEWISRLAGENGVHVALSEGMSCDISSKYVSAKKVLTVSNAIFTESKDCKSNTRKYFSEATLGYISNLCVEKGALTVFDTFRICKKAGVASRLIVAGPVGDRQTEVALNLLISEFGNDVEYRGSVYADAKECFYSDIDIALFPTCYKYEAQPLVVLEALQRGIPVFTTPKGYIPELIGEIGYVLSEKPELFQREVAGKLLYWSENPALYEESSLAARVRFGELRSQSQMQFVELIASLSRGSCALDQ